MLRTICLLAIAPLLMAMAQSAMLLRVPIDPRDVHAAAATNHVVTSIFRYTRWPRRPANIVLCVVGPARHAGQLGSTALSNGTRVIRRNLRADAYSETAPCNALYLGTPDLAELRRWTAAVRGDPVVTIAERDPGCRSEAMFCLDHRRRSLSFQLSIDAISRSGVRVDPRVLRLSSTGREQ